MRWPTRARRQRAIAGAKFTSLGVQRLTPGVGPQGNAIRCQVRGWWSQRPCRPDSGWRSRVPVQRLHARSRVAAWFRTTESRVVPMVRRRLRSQDGAPSQATPSHRIAIRPSHSSPSGARAPSRAMPPAIVPVGPIRSPSRVRPSCRVAHPGSIPGNRWGVPNP